MQAYLFLNRLSYSMKMTELIHNAIDVIILSQFLQNVTVTMLLTFVYCLYHYFIEWSKCNCSHLSKFASNAGKG